MSSVTVKAGGAEKCKGRLGDILYDEQNATTSPLGYTGKQGPIDKKQRAGVVNDDDPGRKKQKKTARRVCLHLRRQTADSRIGRANGVRASLLGL